MSDKSQDRKFEKAARAAEKLGIMRAQRHVSMCCDTKESDCASAKDMHASWKHLKKCTKDLKSRGVHVYRSKSLCFDICDGGPIMVVQPDGVWYGNCTPEVIDRIVDEHLIGGNVVEEFVIARCGFCHSHAGSETK